MFRLVFRLLIICLLVHERYLDTLCISHSSRFWQGLGLQIQVYIFHALAPSTMNYQSSSRSQKKRSPTSSNTASSTPTTSLPPSLLYFTAAASASVPYESPYAQNQDRRPQRPSDTFVRSTSSSTSAYPTSSVLSTTRTPQSKQSSSGSDDSFYDSPGPRSSRYTTPTGTMSSSQRTMSSVS